MASLIQNLNSIYDTKLAIKQVIGTQSDVFSDYPNLIEAAIQGGGGGITPTGTYNVSANGNYDITNYAYVDVNVTASGSSYTITSAYMYDMNMNPIGNFTKTGDVLSYSFSLDAAHSSENIGAYVLINGTDGAYFSPNFYGGDTAGNGTFTNNEYSNLTQWSSTSLVQLDSTLITNQPNISFDITIKLKDKPVLYGYPVDYEYVVSGYQEPENIKFQVYDTGIDQWQDMASLTEGMVQGTFEGDIWGTQGNVRFYSSIDGPLGPNANTTIDDENDAANTNLYINGSGILTFDLTGLYHVTITKGANDEYTWTLTKTLNIYVGDGMNQYSITEGQSGSFNPTSGTLSFYKADAMTPIYPDSNYSLDLNINFSQTINLNENNSSSNQVTLSNYSGNTLNYNNLSLDPMTGNLSVDLYNYSAPAVTDKLRLDFTTAGAANSVELNNGLANPTQVSIDAGTITFTDVASGNNLYPGAAEAVTISNQGAMTQFDVILTANPGTVTVQDTGLYDILVSKKSEDNWTVNFTPSPGA